MRRFLIVVNPTAGSPRRQLFAAVLARLRAARLQVTLVELRNAETAFATIRDGCADHDVVVAAGGDGTVRQAATAIAGFGRPLGLIPLGTGNVLAREIGLNFDPDRIAETLVHGKVAQVKAGLANGQPFYLMAGVGFDGRTIDLLDQRWKRRFGRAAYAGPLLRSWWRAPDKLSITIDSQGYSANWLIVTNVQHYAGHFVLTRETSIFTPGLKAILIRADTPAELALRLGALAKGKLTGSGSSAVQVVDFQTLHVTASSVPVQVDGDSFGCTPLTIEAGGPELQLLVPIPRRAGGSVRL